MRVLCVKPFDVNEAKGKPMPEVGDEDVVTEEAEIWGALYYGLVRFPSDLVYSAEHFATLPDQTADEMEEEEQFIYEPFSC